MTSATEQQLRTAITDQSPTESLTKLAGELVKRSMATWNERFWAASYLWKFENATGRYDNELMDCLEEIQTKGLTVERDKDLFLKTSLILSQLHFKYGRFRQTSNYLLLLREHDKLNAPSWVFNYSAKLYYRIDVATAIASPEIFISYIQESTLRNNGSADNQAIAVTKEFILAAIDYFKTRSTSASSISQFIVKLTNFVELLDDRVSAEWSQLILFYSKISQSSQGQTIGITPSTLDAENRMLVALLEERSKTILEQKEEIVNLELQNQELKETLKNQVTEAEKRKLELVAQMREEIGITSPSAILTHEDIRILVLGTPQIPEKQMLGIATTLGLTKDQLDLQLDYDENKRLNLDSLRYNSPYAGILVGPIAHKVVGLGDHASVIQKLQHEEGFPPIEEIRTHSGELKITKTSFREALSRILTTISANTPS